MSTWTWVKGKQGDWLVKGPKWCEVCGGCGMLGIGPGVKPSACFACDDGWFTLPQSVTVTKKNGQTSEVTLMKCVWRSPTEENVALYATGLMPKTTYKPTVKKVEPIPSVGKMHGTWDGVNPPPPNAQHYTYNEVTAKWEELTLPTTKVAKAYHEEKEKTHLEELKQEEEDHAVLEDEAKVIAETCSNCGKAFGKEKPCTGFDRDGLRGLMCKACLNIPETERDFG